MASLRAFLGIYPKTSDYEAKRQKLEEEYKAILDFESSAEFKRYIELDHYIHSKEFAQKKLEILSLKFRNTEDYHKEMEFDVLTKTKPINLFYKVKDSARLNEFYQTEKSESLKNFLTIEEFIKSPEYKQVKIETSLSGKIKFAKSNLAKKLQLYEEQKKSEKIRGYYRFIKDKLFHDFESASQSGLIKNIIALEKKINTEAFQKKKAAMNKSEFKTSDEKKILDEYSGMINSKTYKNYQKLNKSKYKKYYDQLNNSDEIKTFEELSAFIASPDFKRQKAEIFKTSFKDTKEFGKLKEYNELLKSPLIRNYLKFKDSKEFSNYKNLEGSLRLQEYEKLKAYIKSDKFVQKKNYYIQRPKRRWRTSGDFELIKEFKQLRKSDKIKWYFKNKNSNKFSWLETWHESFSDDFNTSKLDTKKWLTRYFYGEALLNDSYSLSHDKHFVTDGQNLEFNHSTLRILTKKEAVSGKSWHQNFGFITREFAYTSGLINTGKSFRQQYGTFEAKIKFCESKMIQNAFWMVSKTMLPHIDVAKADKKITFNNFSGNPIDLKKVSSFSTSVGRSKFSSEFYIYSLEWTPKQLTWKINGVEVASTSKSIPAEPMYIVLSAGLHKDPDTGFPAEMEIDWVRCYQKDNYK
jgi:beta-glucanase (GH16 family)